MPLFELTGIPTLYRCFQYSVGDARQTRRGGADARNISLSILRWRCRPCWSASASGMPSRTFNTPLEMRSAVSGARPRLRAGSARLSILRWRCKLLQDATVPRHDKDFQYSVGDAVEVMPRRGYRITPNFQYSVGDARQHHLHYVACSCRLFQYSVGDASYC